MENHPNIGAPQQTEISINKPVKVIHCCDGVIEEHDDEDVTPVEGQSKADETDPKTLDWGPWFSYFAWKSGTKVLGAVDYAGETLADFFGITTPKYQIEITEYERVQEEKRKMEEESAGWVPKEGGDIPLVLNEPLKDSTSISKV